MKISQVVFNAAALEVAKDAQAGLLIHKKKTAEVGVEFLEAGARGNEIIIRVQVVELHFDESFLQSQMIVEAVGPAARIGSDNAKLSHILIVQAALRCDADPPIHWFEGSVT